jgi:hypothetical protein
MKPALVIHATSFRERGEADFDASRLGARLGTFGLSEEVDLDEKGIWYRLVLGEFDRGAAARQLPTEVPPKILESVGGVCRMEERPWESL